MEVNWRMPVLAGLCLQRLAMTCLVIMINCNKDIIGIGHPDRSILFIRINRIDYIEDL